MSLFEAHPCTHCACRESEASVSKSHVREPERTVEDTGEGILRRAELMLLIGSALLFCGTLIFSDAIMRSFGLWGLRFLYGIPYLLCGISIYRAAWQKMWNGDYLNEFTLMCGATIAAIILGELPEAVGVMLFYRVGEFLQELATAGSRRSIKNLLASKPATAHVLKDGTVVTLPVEEVAVGAHVQVRAGEKIPLDGMVLEGESQVDQSPLTGESLPIAARAGVAVYAGSLNLSGVLTVLVQSRFADTHVARILSMVEHASRNKSPTERFISRFARYYTPAVVVLALLTALLPPLLVPEAKLDTWVYRALVLLVISCPCALLISIPLGYFGGIGAASRKGILVKGGNVLDNLMYVDTVVFDKTGTLTKGVFAVADVVPAPGIEQERLLRAAAFAEEGSNHPIARSVLAYVRKWEETAAPPAPQGGEPVVLPLPGAQGPGDFGGKVLAREIAGKGMEVVHNGVRYLAGTAELLLNSGVTPLAAPGRVGALVHVAENDICLGYILIADSIRNESRQAVADLRGNGFKTFMLTGDRKETAAWAAGELGLDGYEAELLPEGKVAAIQKFAGAEVRTSRAAFVGDGINDAPVLALSRVGIAMGGMGSEAAIEAADAVILNDSPAKVPELFRLARDVRAIIWQNIFLALGVKIAFMGLGVVGLSGLWEAVFADVGVALLAVLNATRVMRK